MSQNKLCSLYLAAQTFTKVSSSPPPPLSDGVGRTGTFICLHSQLERLKMEGVVDFFQAVKSARIQRAGLIPDAVGVSSPDLPSSIPLFSPLSIIMQLCFLMLCYFTQVTFLISSCVSFLTHSFTSHNNLSYSALPGPLCFLS